MSPRARTFAVLLALWLMVLASSSQVMIVSPILPEIGRALRAPTHLLGTLVTGYAFALSAMAVVIGPISDRVGRRRVLLWGTGAMTLALGAHALTWDFASLAAARILAGLAGGVLTGSAISYIGDYFPYERRGWASGWVMSGFAVGQVLGVPAGTLLADQFGFRAPFLLFAALMVLSFALMVTVVPQPARRVPVAALTVGSALRSYRRLLGDRSIAAATMAYATMFFAVSNFVVFLPTWADRQLGIGPSGIATMFSVGGLAAVLLGPRAGRWSDRIGRKPLIVGSCIGTALLFASLTFLVREPVGAHVMFFVAMSLLAMRLSPFQALLTALVDDDERGTLMSLVVAIGQVGGGLGGTVAGLLYAEVGYLGCTLVAAGSIALTGTIVALRLPEPTRRPPDRPPV